MTTGSERNLKKFKEVSPPVKTLPGEKWTDLPIHTRRNYLISTKGRIYSFYSGRIVKGKICSGVLVFDYTPKDNPVKTKTGKVRTTSKRTKLTTTIQRLVAETFLRKPKSAFLVIHKDYDKLNNAVDNLKWITKELSPLLSGRSSKYKDYKVKRNKGPKLSLNEVNEIKNLLEQKRKGKLSLTIKQIGAKYNVSDMQIYRIQNGDLWAHAGKAIKKKEEPQKLSGDVVSEIKSLLAQGKKGIEIAAMFGVNESRISRIKRDRYYV